MPEPERADVDGSPGGSEPRPHAGLDDGEHVRPLDELLFEDLI